MGSARGGEVSKKALEIDFSNESYANYDVIYNDEIGNRPFKRLHRELPKLRTWMALHNMKPWCLTVLLRCLLRSNQTYVALWFGQCDVSIIGISDQIL